MIHIDAQDFSQELRDVLRTIPGIVGRATVAHGNVQITIGTEFNHAAVVVFVRLRNNQ